MNTPILLLIFNRPRFTTIVMDAIRTVKPNQLFLAADGPRRDNNTDERLCAEARSIATSVNWDCEVKTLFQEENLGCGQSPAEAITWFFSQVEEGIILEDDCVASPDFFVFCSELLARYRHNEEIMHISGNNFSFKKPSLDNEYHFNKYFTAWGWATWRRAWDKYDYNIKELDNFYNSGEMDRVALTARQRAYWKKTFESVRGGRRLDVWDYQWLFTCWYHKSLAVTPPVNLVTNIGFEKDATHTVGEVRVSYVPAETLGLVVHPPKIERNEKLDQLIFKNYFEPPQYLNYLRNFFYGIFHPRLLKPLRSLRRAVLPNTK